jgi:hypothetical protein
MGKVERIEKEIAQLSRSEFTQLREWILERDWAAWDAQIEKDAQGGKLNDVVSESKKDYRAGRARKL